MKKIIEDYLHLYLGCKGRLGSSAIEFTLTAVQSDSSLIVVRSSQDSRSGQFVTPANFKPILRPLSSMTEKERIYVADLLGWHSGDDYYKNNQVGGLFESNGYFNKVTNLTGSQWNKVITYCRGVGIDMDSLIESGLAIDKIKL